MRKIETSHKGLDITIYFGMDIWGNESYSAYLDDGESILEGFYSQLPTFKRHIEKFVSEAQYHEICQIINAYLGSNAPERKFNV